MAIHITARHGGVTEGMKRYASEKGEKLRRFFDGLNKIEIILDGEGKAQRAEAVISVQNGDTIVVHAEAEQMNAAIDGMIAKAETRVRKFKDKIRDRRGPPPEPPEVIPTEDDGLETYDEIIDRTDFPEN